MKIRKIIIILIVILVIIVGLNYIRLSMKKAAMPPQVGKSPSLDEAPVRVYGLIEPLGREVFVGPIQPRRVVRIYVKEGDLVKANELLIQLDDDLERQSLQIAESRREEAVRRLKILENELIPKRELARREAIRPFELSQLELQAKLQEQQIATASAEVEMAKAQLDKLQLRSPITGVVYKMDVRLGELLTPQDYGRIIIGSPQKQVRMFVETFWLDRVHVGQRFVVKEAETLREVGQGEVVSISNYVGARDFRTEDKLERIDTKYGQAILKLDKLVQTPIGMLVVCEKLD